MKPLAPAIALAACAAPGPQGHGARKEGVKGGGMMDEMCKRRAAEPGRAASAPDMMDKHCRARAEAPTGAASHVH